MTTPTPSTPLTAEDVTLLKAGDWLMHETGPFQFVRVRDQGQVVVNAPTLTPYDAPSAFRFIGRPDPEGWIPAPEGGWTENPVPGQVVEVRLRSGSEFPTGSDDVNWSHPAFGGKTDTGHGDIIAFRLVSAEPDRAEGGEGERLMALAAAADADGEYDQAFRLMAQAAELAPPTPAVEGEDVVRKALEFYADPENYFGANPYARRVLKDNGHVARKALAALTSAKETGQ